LIGIAHVVRGKVLVGVLLLVVLVVGVFAGYELSMQLAQSRYDRAIGETVESIRNAKVVPYIVIADRHTNEVAGKLVGFRNRDEYWFTPNDPLGQSLFQRMAVSANLTIMRDAAEINHALVVYFVARYVEFPSDAFERLVVEASNNLQLHAVLPGPTFVFRSFSFEDVGLMEARPLWGWNLTDALGIPLYDYGGRVQPPGLHYNPQRIAGVAMGYYAAAIASQGEARAEMTNMTIRLVDWLLMNRLVSSYGNATFSVWPYGFAYSRGAQGQWVTCKAPWFSSMAQGQGIRALLRGYSLTNNTDYLAAIDQSLKAFLVPIESQGVAAELNGYAWYEEYACPGIEPSYALNGFIISLLGPYEVAVSPTMPKETVRLAKYIWSQAIFTLTATLHLFDNGKGMSYYDLQFRYVSPAYHRLHLRLLKTVFQITHSDTIEEYLVNWMYLNYVA